MFQGLSNIAQLLKQAREIQGRAADLRERVAQIRASGSAGGGMVTVEASGDQRVLAVRIDPGLASSGDRELLEDLCAAATNQALQNAREAAAGVMQELTAGLNLPGLNEALSQFGIAGT
jgi:DNA-binding YbaB/EbfC family protein